ncbi:MAG: FAD-dependent oxidoreductase [Lentihominibacter sp.]
MKRYEALFTPFKINTTEIRNRFVMCPMTGAALIVKNQYNRKAEEYYLKRSENETGLIITSPSMVLDMWGRGYWLNDADDVFTGPLHDFVERIHDNGTKIFMQLGVGLGRVLNPYPIKAIEGAQIENVRFAASKIPNVWNREIIHRPLTVDEIHRLRDATIESARLAQKAGMDGVEIHAVHEGYLLDQFAISSMNNRTDEYGGSLENRMRFACEIIRGIKQVCGEQFPVMVRYSVASKMKGFNQGALPGEEYEEFGRSLEESPMAAKLLENAGCDALNADNGTYDSWYWAHPPMYMERACNLEDAAYIKKHVNIPVICAGRMEDPEISNAAVEKNMIDAIGVARQFLADAQWVKKLRGGKPEDIRPCIACHNGCLGSLLQGYGLSCALDPSVMHEEEYRLEPAGKAKKVLIAGGGIGGMEAARLCTLRGHRVRLYEKSDRLAGVFNAAAAPDFKEADKKLIAWYERQMKLLDIDISMNTEVTAELIDEENPDVVITATGAFPKKLDITGADEQKVISAVEYLYGTKTAGRNVIVVGGGLTGCEIAYDAARKGSTVTIVEFAENILTAKMLSAANSSMLRDLLNYYNVEILTSSKISRLTGDEAVIDNSGEIIRRKVDSIIVSVGYMPDQELYKKLEDRENVYNIGDSLKVGNLMDVIKSAYKAALSI